MVGRMKCQIRNCNEEAEYVTMLGDKVSGHFCRRHCYDLTMSNWCCKVEKLAEVNGIKSLGKFR